MHFGPTVSCVVPTLISDDFNHRGGRKAYKEYSQWAIEDDWERRK